MCPSLPHHLSVAWPISTPSAMRTKSPPRFPCQTPNFRPISNAPSFPEACYWHMEDHNWRFIAEMSTFVDTRSICRNPLMYLSSPTRCITQLCQYTPRTYRRSHLFLQIHHYLGMQHGHFCLQMLSAFHLHNLITQSLQQLHLHSSSFNLGILSSS
jgi:hypothetical protein